jgi:hypothetical protein
MALCAVVLFFAGLLLHSLRAALLPHLRPRPT